jgi:hypothetical protein
MLVSQSVLKRANSLKTEGVMMRLLSLFLSAVMTVTLCVGCTKIIKIKVPFVSANAEYIRLPGNNTINVNSFLRQRGGGVVLCAASPVELWPVTDFSRVLVKDMVGSEDGGEYMYHDPMFNMKVSESEEFLNFREYARKVVCDSEGHAVFNGVPDGEYYIYLHLSWEVLGQTFFGPGPVENGAYMVDRVRVNGGQTLNHTVTRASRSVGDL